MTVLTQQTPVESKTILWLKWTAAYVLADAIMLPLMHYLPIYLPGAITQSTNIMNLVRLLVLVLNSFVLSYFSALAIRSYLPNLRQWIFLSTITWVLGSVVSVSPLIQNQSSSSSALVNYVAILASLAVLVPLGVAQWLILRIHYQKSGFLILWYFGSGALINLAFSFFFSHFPTISSYLSASPYGVVLGFNLLIEFCLFAIIGIGIVSILSHPYDQTAPDAVRTISMGLLLQWVSWTLTAISVFEICRIFGVLGFIAQGIFANPPWNSVLVGLFYGLLFGCLQVLFFRQQVKHASLWIAVTIIGSGLLYLSQATGANSGLLTGGQNPPSFLVLAFTALGWLALGACQAVILNVWQFPRAWAWIQITFAAYGLSYLVQFFISARLGLVVLSLLTGLGLLYILKTASGETWYVAPVDPAGLTANALESLRFILQARLSDLFGLHMRVSALENCLAIAPIDPSLDETLTSLLTQPGKVKVARSTSAPATGANSIETAAPLFTSDDILLASVRAEDAPGQKLIQLTLTEEALARCNAEMDEGSGAQFFLLVDGEVIHTTPIELSEKHTQVEIRHLDTEDAEFYRAMLNSDPLPVAVSLTKEEYLPAEPDGATA